MASSLRSALVVLGSLVSPGVSAQQLQLQGEALPVSGPRLFALTASDFTSGAVVELDGAGPAVEALAPTDGALMLRRFGQQLFAVNRYAGTIQRVPMNGGASQDYELGRNSQPMDVLVPATPVAAPGLAWVTRREDPFLYLLDLASGTGRDALDISPVGGGAAIALGTMVQHDTRLFVQVRVSAGDRAVPAGDTGVLAVVDLASGALLDVDGSAPGIQGITLQGAPPRFKMQILGETLFVSTTDSFYDARGGIEQVDLGTLSSVGYAITEEAGHSDMGGFVMVDAEGGYYVFHTDLLPSTHLQPFTVAGGPGDGMIVLLGDTVDVLVLDGGRRRLYLPSGFSSGTPGLSVFDTDSNALVGELATGLPTHDALLVHALLPFGPPR